MTESLLGTIVRCQVSAQALVRSGHYIADDIVEADELHISPDGLVGWCDGRAVLNHHHRLNPKLRAWKPKRLLSIGFTGHYDAMAERFGAAPVGCAAENIIVDLARVVTEEELAAGVELRATDQQPVRLDEVAVAKPCVPFTKFMLEDQEAADEVVAPNRAFLEAGMRGFVFGLSNVAAVDPEDGRAPIIRPGDEVWLRS